MPNIIPHNVEKNPIEKPVKKKDFLIELLLKPSVFNIAISFVVLKTLRFSQLLKH